MMIQKSKQASHEEMSLQMIDYIVDEHNIDIDSGLLKKVKEMIIASSENAPAIFSLKGCWILCKS